MGDGVSISQNEIDMLLGFSSSPSSSSAPETPSAPKPPPTVESKPTHSPFSSNNTKAETVSFQPLTESKQGNASSEIALVKDIPLELTVELGRAKRTINDILDFGLGTVVELNRLAGEPVDLLANGKQIAKGEVVIIDENFAVRITEIVQAKKLIVH